MKHELKDILKAFEKKGILSFATLAVMYFPECAGYLSYKHRHLTARQYKITTKHTSDSYKH